MRTFAAVLLLIPSYSDVVAAGPAGGSLRSATLISRETHVDCPDCAAPQLEHGALKSFPCTASSNSSARRPSQLVFHYGANMGCKKLTAIDVEPQSAQSAYIPGWCLRFGKAEGVPTSATEPAFGNLVPCKGGCVHGMVHAIPDSQLARIDATETGYELKEIPEVMSYTGERLAGVRAYIMQGRMTVKAPSRRYGGLLYCSAKEELAPSYAEQLSCELAEHDIRDLKCTSEKFMPLAAQSGALSSKHHTGILSIVNLIVLWAGGLLTA